jgi:hypothetical protein
MTKICNTQELDAQMIVNSTRTRVCTAKHEHLHAQAVTLTPVCLWAWAGLGTKTPTQIQNGVGDMGEIPCTNPRDPTFANC